MSAKGTLHRLYTGEGGIDFVGRRRTWYRIAAAVIVICFGAMLIRGFSLGIDFEGGTKMNMPGAGMDKVAAQQIFEDATGQEASEVQIVGAGDTQLLEIQSRRLSEEQISKARQALYDQFQPKDADGQPSPDVIGDSTVSESWGSTITDRMLLALGVFFCLIFLYIMARFERDMAIAAMAGIAVDAVVICGVYALIGFEVTPATVIGLLTVLAFSLYDTVVVFDKVKENTAGFIHSHTKTYAEHANLAVNQTVMRSIATTAMSALPIASLMVVAVWLMGVGTLKDLSLVQLIGVIEGTFSSIFLATPILVSIKNRQKKIKKHNEAVAKHRDGAQDRDFEPVEEHAPFGVIGPDPDKTSLGATWRPGQ